MIDEAASLLPVQRLALCLVTKSRSPRELHSIAFGDPGSAWEASSEVSAAAHILYLDAPVRRVLSLIPDKYDDMWTGAKGFYKVEPIVADGGQVVLYAPHIRELSTTHPAIAEIGYHCRDYFVKQWDRFKGYHWGDLAHSTHLRGVGSYDAVHGERDRVTVALATGISEEQTRAVNLDYLDPAGIDPEAWAADPDTLVVPDAGEDLFRLR
jgi:lactate racemase